MTFIDSIWRAWERLSDFSGTASRTEFFAYLVFAWLLAPLISALMFLFCSFYEAATLHYFWATAPIEVAAVTFVILQLPLFALSSRRMRDAGLSPWLSALGLIPLLGPAGVAALATKRAR